MMSSGSSIVVEPAAAKEEDTGKPEPEPAGGGAVKTMTEKVPDSFIARIKTHPIPRPRPLPEHYLTKEVVMSCYARINAMVDLEQDCLRQHAEKGYAEVGVDFTDGVKTIFILPQH